MKSHSALGERLISNFQSLRDAPQSLTSNLQSPISNLQLLFTFSFFLAHTLFYAVALGGDAVDDAYISFRYAQNAILGYGLVFNPGERVEGFTNFLWTALMIPLEGAGMDVGRGSMVLGVLFALAIMWLVVRFAKIVDAPPSVGMLAVLLLAVDGSFTLWAISGLETAMFAFLIFAGAVLYAREQIWDASPSKEGAERGWTRRKNTKNPRLSALVRVPITFPFSGIFFALAAMTRPEGLMVFAITVAHQAAWRVLAERRLFTFRDLARIFAFSAFFAPYWLGRWWYYASFLPNSFYAKVSAAGPAAQLTRGWNHLSQFVNVHLGWIVVVPPLFALAASVRNFFAHTPTRPHSLPPLPLSRAPRAFWMSYLAAILVPYAAYIVYVGGDWSVGRFFVPLLAPFYLLFSTGLVDLWKWAVDKWSNHARPRAAWLGITASIVFAGLVFGFSSWNGEYGIFIRGFDAGTATAARAAMGKWLRTSAPRGTVIAVDAAGQVPYFSGLPAIDMFGINDLHIGRMTVSTLGQGTPGHEKFDLGYVIGRTPTYVIIYGTLLDGVREYDRAPATWTDNTEYLKFLTLYVRRKE
ncbi:MAG: hypothetical protein HY782_04785 [Chloroflexi bacterium]|nr:hypothetical protein [Chloroflexota bacterium]